MRALLPAATVCLLLSSLTGGFAGALADPSGDPVTGAPPTPTPTSVTPAPAAPAASTPVAANTAGADSDAAAKHAKRTACLKDAKTKKLLGAQKTAYVKDCVAAP
jgi:hypothetical protein